MNNLIEFLKQEGVSAQLVEEVRHYSEEHTVDEALKKRIPVPHFHYYGNKVWEEALAVLLCGRNLLLAGEKATGKNVLAQNLAAVFERPAWDISFHVNMDAAALIGSDTFHDGRVTFRPGPVYCCAQSGGFGILDEINMARNEALAVLHSVLDFRRVIDVPGYDRIDLHPATRFIATMNYGYSGTKELNEALVSRFAVIKMPMISKDNLIKLIQDKFETISEQAAEEFANVFLDLQKKCENSEISSKALDIRGLLDSIALMEKGLEVHTALDMGITNKSFDMYEQTLIKDTIGARISKKIKTEDLFKK